MEWLRIHDLRHSYASLPGEQRPYLVRGAADTGPQRRARSRNATPICRRRRCRRPQTRPASSSRAPGRRPPSPPAALAPQRPPGGHRPAPGATPPRRTRLGPRASFCGSGMVRYSPGLRGAPRAKVFVRGHRPSPPRADFAGWSPENAVLCRNGGFYLRGDTFGGNDHAIGVGGHAQIALP